VRERINAYGRAAVIAALAVCVSATFSEAGNVTITDAEALATVRKHCTVCHAAKPTHPAFDKPPNGVTLETIADVKKYASRVYAQTVQNKAMPLGNQTRMTDDERATLGLWLKALP
jgi:uncharacterized membrane protein